MPQRKGKGKKQQKSGNRPVVDVSGMLARIGLPVPRLPFLIGSSRNLSANLTVYPRMVKLDFPIIPQFISVAAGAASSVISININLVEQVTALQALFGEYALVGAIFEVRVTAVTTPQGIYIMYIDEKGAGAPTAAIALDSPHIDGLLTNTENPSLHKISWKAADFLDLDWTVMSSSSDTPIYLKTWASTAATGTAAGTAAQIMVTGALAFCFRGYSNEL